MSGIVQRVNYSYHSPCHLLPKRWSAASTYVPAGGSTYSFSQSSGDPNTSGPNSGPFPINYATGIAGPDGNFTVALTGGFTPSITLTVWEFNRRAFNNGDAPWFKLGNSSTLYSAAFDATYTMGTFKASEGSIILIQASGTVTGNVYIDGFAQDATIGTAREGF